MPAYVTCSLIVRSSLNYFPVHQPAVTNSMYLQSTYNHPTFTAPFQSEEHLQSSQTAAVELFFGNSRRPGLDGKALSVYIVLFVYFCCFTKSRSVFHVLVNCFGPSVFYNLNTNQQIGMVEPLVNHFTEEKKSKFILHISCLCSLKFIFFLMKNLRFSKRTFQKKKKEIYNY